MDRPLLQDEFSSCIRVYPDRVQLQQCMEKLQRLEPMIPGLAPVLSLAGGVTRFKILYLLEEETGLCVCDLSDILGMPIPDVSEHLQKLKATQVIQARRVGQTVFYSLQN